MNPLEQLRDAVVDGEAADAVAATTAALEQGVDAEELLQDGLMAAMREVGRQFEEEQIYVPEMLMCAQAMRSSLAVLEPHLVDQEARTGARVAIGTVEGDLHDIGKNLVAMMHQGSGFEVEDLGVDVGPDKFLAAARNGAHVIAMSALLTTTMTNMQRVVQAITEAGLRDEVRIVVGGAPITQAYCDEIGADAFAKTASSAVRTVQGVLGLAGPADERTAAAH
jgi:5-methyltetrahydrofolate--homocysteine methyltransferase